MICKDEDSKGRCRQSNVVYEIKCGSCESRYIGETSRNGYTRGREHLKEYEKKSKESVLHKHTLQKHSSDDHSPKFTMKILSSHMTAIDRQVTEAVRIANAPGSQLMNSKQEFGHNRCWRFDLSDD